jgi:hypothetical protein
MIILTKELTDRTAKKIKTTFSMPTDESTPVVSVLNDERFQIYFFYHNALIALVQVIPQFGDVSNGIMTQEKT